MGYVEIKDFWDVISYKGNSAGTPVTRSARVFLNIHTCMYFWAQEQRTKGVERFATIATPPPPPRPSHFYVWHFDTFSTFFVFSVI